MIINLLYKKFNLPICLIKKILEYCVNDPYDINYCIKTINLQMLNSNGIIKFNLLKLSRVKLPKEIKTNYVVNYLTYNNYEKFCFTTPFINVFSHPFGNTLASTFGGNCNPFNFVIGLNKLEYEDLFEYEYYNLSKVDCEENNSLTNQLLKLENYLYCQICKNGLVEKYKFEPIVKTKPIFDKYNCLENNNLDSDLDNQEKNIIGYHYSIKLIFEDSITKYFHLEKKNGKMKQKPIFKSDVNVYLGTKIKFVLTPIICFDDKLENINTKFLVNAVYTIEE